MKSADFVCPASGSLVLTIDRYPAFVPAPLPPSIEIGPIAIAMARAMQALGELKGACRRLQNPDILVRPLQRLEALTSSAMEGTFTTDDNLLLAEADASKIQDESTLEVVNYLRALDESLSLLKTLPISHRVIRRAHALLLQGLGSARGAQKRPGEYKREQNWIGGRTIEAARYVPPPPIETQRCMDDLEKYINRENVAFPEPLIDLALVHYQIEAIHPFSDGNGRVGRMLISLMAVHNGLLDTPVLYISPVMERHKDRYIDLMLAVSTRGAWTAWINFFFDRVAESCQETTEAIDRLLSLQVLYRERAGKLGRSANMLKLVDLLFERPVTTVTAAAQAIGVTYASAKTAIDKLVEAEILEEYPAQYPKLYWSRAIFGAARPYDRATRPSTG